MRVSEGRDATPSAVVLDSQSVETATMVAKAVGFDAAKHVKGRKRHLLVDTLGLVVMVVRSGCQCDRVGGGATSVCYLLHQLRSRFPRLVRIWVDGGYRGEDFMRWVMDTYRWILEVVLRREGVKGFEVLPRRWVVERTFGWFNWCRRLSKDYEILPETSQAFIHLAMIRLMLKRLA